MTTPRMHRRKILAGNWKMNLSPGEACAYFAELSERLVQNKPESWVNRVIFPAAYCLSPHVFEAAGTAHVELGGQNVHWEEKGAFTGELSARGLRDVGARWALIAHSERRQYFGETDQTAAKRLPRALTSGLNIIFCVGENLEEREGGRTEAVLTRQLAPFAEALKAWSTTNAGAAGCLNDTDPTAPVVALAYEPVWAIGTGKTATPEQAQTTHAFIRAELERLFKSGPEALVLAATRMPLLYGGSVTADNANTLLKLPNVDGVLVGGASLKPDAFAQIVKAL